MSDTTTFDQWAVVELMGHRRLAGRVTEEEHFGTKLLRIDIPSEPPATQYYGSAAIYAVTPTTEDLCRRFSERYKPEPVNVWELPAPRHMGSIPPASGGEYIDRHGIRHDPDPDADHPPDDDFDLESPF